MATAVDFGSRLRYPRTRFNSHDLLYQAQTTHRANFNAHEVQRSTLLSVKTGGCPEDCAYCPQSAHYKTGVERHGPTKR